MRRAFELARSMAQYNPLEGVAQLTRQLQALGSLDDGKALQRCVRAGIKQALPIAIAACPVGHDLHRLAIKKRLKVQGIKGNTVGPGFAKANVRVIATLDKSKTSASGLLGVRKAAFYVLQYVELGTRFQRAQPWLRNAFLQARDAMEEALKASLAADVEKAARTS
jgi:HK97 gp10 family phage protein